MARRGANGYFYPVFCAACGEDLPNGGSHIVLSPYGPDLHKLFCPACCPCRHQAAQVDGSGGTDG